MPSTFSTNLGLELPATGEQSGTWGTTANLNIGTLLEQAISGFFTQAITDGADTTITMPDGAAGVARNMMISMSGTLSAPRNLIVPAKRKLYFIGNNTAGGHNVTVKCAGQVGVAVPNGKWMLLACGGADVFTATTYMAGDISGNAATATTATNATTAAACSGNAATATFATSAGTASTVTNGLVSTGSYPNPTWLTSLDPAKLSYATPVLYGGTGANSVSAARSNLGLGTMATQNSSAVSITGGTVATSTLSGTVALANGGTGSSTGGAFLHYGSGASAVVTAGTGAATGGSDGDVHFQYV